MSAAPAKRRIIDVHHHRVPPFYADAVGREAITRQSAAPSQAALAWPAGASLDEMDAQGVAAAVLSLSAPGLWFGDAAFTRDLARRCNDDLAACVARHPSRFGMFAALPLPGVADSLDEIAYAGDQLRSDGFGIFSSYGDRYPGEAEFAPVFDALNERHAVVFVHPNMTGACSRLLPDVPVSMLEFPLDTTRAAMSLLYGGTLARCPNIRFVFAHAGGSVPYLAHRMSRLEALGPQYAAQVPGGAMALLARQFYDTALSATPPQWAALERFVPSSQVLFGSDCPFAPGAMGRTVHSLEAFGLDRDALHAVQRGNAARLFPRLAQA